MTQTGLDPSPDRPRRTRSRTRRAGEWALHNLFMLALFAGILVLLVVGQTMHAPDWLRDRIEARIEHSLGGMQIDFGEMEFVLRKGWRPRLHLRDVVLSGADGQVLARLADAEASLAMRPLLRGEVQPRQIELSGAYATLRRDAEGAVALSFSKGAAPVRQAADLPNLIEGVDRVLSLPQLSALRGIDMTELTLRFEDVRQGRAWTLDGGRIALTRSGGMLQVGSSFALLSGRDFASLVEVNYSGRIGDTEAEFGVVVQDMPAQDVAAQSVALAWLDVLRAPISGALRGSIDADGALGPLSATLQIGAGVLQPTDQTRPIPFSAARSYFTYQPEQQVLVFDELSVSSAWGSGMAEGRAYLGGAEQGRLNDLIGQFTLSGLSLNPAGLYAAPLEIDAAAMDFRLELNPFRLTLGQMHVTDRESRLRLAGALSAEAEGWALALDGEMDRLTPGRLMEFWPEGAVAKPRGWVAANLSGGTLADLDFALRTRPGGKPDIYLDFAYADATIRFLRSMPPITGADGQASLHQGRFVATATRGEVLADDGGAVDVSGTSFIIPDIGVRPGAPAIVRLTGAGSVTAIMSLLNRPPLQVLKSTPLPVDLAQGRARVEGTLALPLKRRVPFDEITFHLTGRIDEVSSTVLVPGHTITAPALEIVGDQTQIVLSGPGRIGDVPAEVRWRQPLGKGVTRASRAEGTVELSPRLIETFRIGLPAGSVSGQGSGAFALDLAPGSPPQLSLTSDLTGVGLSLPALGWSKTEPSSGLLELTGALGQQARIDKLVLQAAGLSATGTVLNRPGGGLERALLSSVRLGNWLDASVELVGRGARAPDLRILSGSLDMRRATFGGGAGGGSGRAAAAPRGEMQVALNRLQVTDTIALTDFAGTFRTAGGLDGRFRGRVNGQAEVVGQVVPQDGRSAFRIQSEDAGGVFRAAGVLKQARGGDLAMTLLPAEKTGEFNGTLRVTNTQVRDAPAIAALLNSVSLVGFLDEMAGQGIQFSEVDARFRLSPSRLTLYESSAVGPSIGLSMDGLLDVPTGTLDMRGVISPVYMINSIGSVMTRKGEGLLGFNYTLKGPALAPRVEVNPLSALAPGMFREILRPAAPTGEVADPPGRRQPRVGAGRPGGER